ncbi:hypothetical protein [Kribbella catacumbae]|uniref:hypothetical protein n=1 Tax=Kribbella catacumbae TaxID=460086 RepID=UPI000373ECA5|nr:hypothetical protein [Kribbella catacumbae]
MGLSPGGVRGQGIENQLLISPGRDYWNILLALEKLDCLTGVVDRVPPFVLSDYGRSVY